MATERLKTDDEIVAEEKERLEKLEADRVRRMKGDGVAEANPADGAKVIERTMVLKRVLSVEFHIHLLLIHRL